MNPNINIFEKTLRGEGCVLEISPLKKIDDGRVVFEIKFSGDQQKTIYFTSRPYEGSEAWRLQQFASCAEREFTEGGFHATRLYLEQLVRDSLGTLRSLPSKGEEFKATPHTPDLTTALRELATHPCSYGYESALQRTDCYIVELRQLGVSDTNDFNVILPLVHRNDSVWVGDCGVHAALFFSALSRIAPHEEILLHTMGFRTPDNRQVLPHKYISVKGMEYRFDGSKFFSSLDETHAEHTITTLSPSFPFGVRWELALANRSFYKEFEHEGKLYAVSFCMRKIPAPPNEQAIEGGIEVEVGFLEQESGKILREFGTILQMEYSPHKGLQAISRQALRDILCHNKGYECSAKGITGILFPQGRFTNECTDLIITLWNALRRGQILESQPNLALHKTLEHTSMIISTHPTDWWTREGSASCS